MSYPCPRCGKTTEVRRWRATGITGGPSAGVHWLFGWTLFPRYICPEHGLIPRGEFLPAQRRRIAWGSALRLLVGLVCLGILGWFLYSRLP
jgi:hypothetical protein